MINTIMNKIILKIEGDRCILIKYTYLILIVFQLLIPSDVYSDDKIDKADLLITSNPTSQATAVLIESPKNGGFIRYKDYKDRYISFKWTTLEAKNREAYPGSSGSKYELAIGTQKGSFDLYRAKSISPKAKQVLDHRILELEHQIPVVTPSFPKIIPPHRPFMEKAVDSRTSISKEPISELAGTGFVLTPPSNLNPFNDLQYETTVDHKVYYKKLAKNQLPIDREFHISLVTRKNVDGKLYRDISYSKYKIISSPSEITSHSNNSKLNSTTVTFNWEDLGAKEIKLSIGSQQGKEDLFSKSYGRKNGDITTSQKVKNLYNRGRDIYLTLSSYSGNRWITRSYTYKTEKDNARNCSDTSNVEYEGSTKKFYNLDLGDKYSDLNNYLMAQASAKTYPRDFRNGNTSEEGFRCSAEQLYNHWGFSKVDFIDSGVGTSAIIASNDDSVVIAIRGTEDDEGLYEDLRSNAGKFNVPFKNLYHAGYHSEGNKLADQINRLRSRHGLKGKEKRLFVTGHSLGGAVAIMTSYHLKDKYNYNVQTYTFAAPEVGSDRYTNNLKSMLNLYVTVNYRDPIPYVHRTPTLVNIGEHGLTSGVSNIFGQGYSTNIVASKYTNYFDKYHDIFSFIDKSYIKVSSFIKYANESPKPYALGLINTKKFMTPEWHFHNVNFYVAFTYKKIRGGWFFKDLDLDTKNPRRTYFSRYRSKIGTSMLPEFTSKKICVRVSNIASNIQMNWEGETSYQTLLSDRQSVPFMECR